MRSFLVRKINNFKKTLSLRAKVPNIYGARLYIEIYIEIYKICVEVFEKAVSPSEMIDHSFKRKFYEACHKLC